MKQNVYFILFLFLAGIFPGNVFGQKIEISPERFSQIYNPVISNTEKQTRRIKFQREQTFTGLKIKGVQKSIVEIIPPDKISFYTIDSDRPEEEIAVGIYIGNTIYSKKVIAWNKKPDNSWITKEVEKPRSLLFFNPPLSNKDGVKWFLTENISINGQMADLIECVLYIKSRDEKTLVMDDFAISGEWKYWISKDNLLIRSEHYQNDKSFKSNNEKLIYEYEYDPNIRIEAPVIKEKEKP